MTAIAKRRARMKHNKHNLVLAVLAIAAACLVPEITSIPFRTRASVEEKAAPAPLVRSDAAALEPRMPEANVDGVANPFGPYPVARLAAKSGGIHWIRALIAALLLSSAAMCVGMIALRRRWQVVRKNGRMASKLATAIKRGVLQVNGFGRLRNQRSSARVAYQGTAKIWWKGKYFKHTVKGSCVDLSATGVGLLCSTEVPVGIEVRVQLQTGGIRRRAEVKHCQAHTSKYSVGLHFVDAVEINSSAA